MTGIVVIGAGLIGARHARAVAAHPDARLVAVVDPDPARHTDPGLPYLRDMSEVGRDAQGAIIATPTGLHADHACAAMDRGWDILIEKPVAATLDQADRIVAHAHATGARTLVGHHRRYHPSIARLRALVHGGGIGTPVTSTLIWAMRKPDDYFQGNWRSTDGSPVMINLVHDIDLLRHVLGDITDMAGLPGAALRGAGRLESGGVVLRLASGATATISFADTTASPWGFEAGTGENPHIGTTAQDMWWITGTAGGISFPSLTHWTGAQDWCEPARPDVIACETATPLAKQLDHFLAVINGAQEPLITVADARETLAATLAVEALLTAKSKG